MACPVLREPVDEEAAILRRNLREERLLRPPLDILSFPDNFLHDRYRFSAQSIIYRRVSCVQTILGARAVRGQKPASE